MLEMIGSAIAYIFGNIVAETIFPPVFRFLHLLGLRAYSLFLGNWALSNQELLDKYDDSVWPWILTSLILVGIPCLLVLVL